MGVALVPRNDTALTDLFALVVIDSGRRACSGSTTPNSDPRRRYARPLRASLCFELTVSLRVAGTSALDTQTEQRLQKAIEREQAERGMTVM